MASTAQGKSKGNPRAGRSLAPLAKITPESQGLADPSPRAVPVQTAFREMNRLVRELARRSGKDIDLIFAGDAELDRRAVEAITDSLAHLVRNACEHGIERPRARSAANKLRAGWVTLRAYQQAGAVVIEVNDDGRGLRKEKILRRAIEAGLVSPGEPLTDEQVFALIFHPGLTTAGRATAASGRGIGMDVVKRNVEALRGRVEIASKEGVGTTFTLRLPLATAVTDGFTDGMVDWAQAAEVVARAA